MNAPFDANSVLDSLANTRKVFHSEADLQFAFALMAKSLYQHLQVRLETHPSPSESLDLALWDPSTNLGIAIEFKYKTSRWSGTCDGESYLLKPQGGADIGCYDIVKDITRIERFIESQKGWRGYVIAITNDSSYWRARTHGRPTNAEAFRVSDGLTLSGTRAWGPNTGGTKKRRDHALNLRGVYEIKWRDFSQIGVDETEVLKALVIQIS